LSVSGRNVQLRPLATVLATILATIFDAHEHARQHAQEAQIDPSHRADLAASRLMNGGF
jgi:hypothetical protein